MCRVYVYMYLMNPNSRQIKKNYQAWCGWRTFKVLLVKWVWYCSHKKVLTSPSRREKMLVILQFYQWFIHTCLTDMSKEMSHHISTAGLSCWQDGRDSCGATIERSAKPATAVRDCVCTILVSGFRKICWKEICGKTENRYFKPKYDLFLTPNKCFLCLNLTGPQAQRFHNMKTRPKEK